MSIDLRPKAIPSIPQLLPVFQQLSSSLTFDAALRTSPKRFYQRLLTPLVVVWCFVFQRLNADHTCDAVVDYVASGGVDGLDGRQGKPVSQRIISESTSAYCKARKRLPLALFRSAMEHFAHQIREGLGVKAQWLGHHVTLLDGTTFLLRPEPELVKQYGQHKNQYGPGYWVVVRAVAAFCLRTGALVGLNEGPVENSEQALSTQVLAHMSRGDVCVGDCNFGVFSVAQAARHYGVQPVFRLTEQRALALAKSKLYSGADVKVQWSPSAEDNVDPTMSMAPIAGRLIFVRLERKGFRPVDLYLFTTLLDECRYSVPELVELYGYRWNVELNLRYVKDTLDMGLLSGKSLDIIRKELYAGAVAYNIIRGYMALAGQQAGISPLALSFSSCLRRVTSKLFSLRPTDSIAYIVETVQRLLARLAKCRLPKRSSFRIEPRAVRRRPAVYPNLKGSRAEARLRTLELLQQGVKS